MTQTTVKTVKNYIGGEWVDSSTSLTFIHGAFCLPAALHVTAQALKPSVARGQGQRRAS